MTWQGQINSLIVLILRTIYIHYLIHPQGNPYPHFIGGKLRLAWLSDQPQILLRQGLSSPKMIVYLMRKWKLKGHPFCE